MNLTNALIVSALMIFLVACSAPVQTIDGATGDAPTDGSAPGRDGEDPSSIPPAERLPPIENTTGTGDQDGAGAGGGGVTTTPPAPQQVSLVAYDWGWDPSTITVRSGVPVVLTITSRSGEHGFAIAALGLNSGTFGPGETKTVEFTPDAVGEYEFRCNVFCGTGHGGMRGTLVVTQ